jgi:DNA-binding transcriptional LysR family regulator
VKIREVETFLAVAELRSFRAASERLHVSASTVSETIGKLERQLGVRLFDRSTHHVLPLPSAMRLITPAREAIAAHRQLERSAKTIARHPSVRVGCFYGHGAAELRAAGRLVELSVVVDIFEWSTPACGLDQPGSVDAALLIGPTAVDPRLQRIGIWSEDRFAVLPERNPLARESTITLGQLDEIGWINIEQHDAVWKSFWRCDVERGGAPSEIGQALTNGTAIVEAVLLGRGAFVSLRSLERVFGWSSSLRFTRVSDVSRAPIDLAFRADSLRRQELLLLAEATRHVVQEANSPRRTPSLDPR